MVTRLVSSYILFKKAYSYPNIMLLYELKQSGVILKAIMSLLKKPLKSGYYRAYSGSANAISFTCLEALIRDIIFLHYQPHPAAEDHI